MQSGLEHLPQEELQASNTWPLSFAQEELWLLHDLAPNNSAYNICRLLRFQGELNVEALCWSLNQIIARHETLRTTFAVCDEQPCQIISPQASLDLVTEELLNLDEAEKWIRTMELAKAEAKQPFNLRHGPLLRARLLKLAGTEHALLLCVHHIICDGWSIELLFRELEDFYNCACTGAAVSLTELPIQYADYALWQRELLQGKVLDEQLAYWREQLSGAAGVLELPVDRPRPAVRSYRGDIVWWHLSESLSRQLEQFAQKHEATLFMVLLAAFQTLLWRYTGNKDVLVGAPVANRQRLEAESLIGLLVNTLTFRARINPNDSFAALLAQVRETCLDGYAHQQLPFEKLVQELQPERSLAHSPLFQVMLTLPGTPRTELNLHQLKTQIEIIHYAASKYDLSLTATHGPSRELKFLVEYNTDLFDEQTIKRMMGHLQELLGSVCAGSAQQVRALPLLSRAERRQLAGWNETAVDYGLGCVQEVIAAQAQRTPAAVAVCCGEEQLSYQELNERANQLAHYLQRQGVGAEVLVGIMLPRSLALVVTLLGVLKAGGAYVPLDAGYPAARLRYMLQDCGARLLLTEASLGALVEEVSGSETRVQVIKVDEQWAEIGCESRANPASAVRGDNLAYLIYTSGSTGQPKGVMIAHAGVTNHMAWLQAVHPLTEQDAMLQKTSFSFDASMLEFYWPLMYGARLVLAKEKADLDTAYLSRLIDEQQVTTVYFPASALQMFLSHRQAGTCQSLQYACSAAEVMPLTVAQAFLAEFPGAELHNLYGPTEATIDVTSWRCEQASGHRSVPIGRPLANTQVHVLDEWLERVPVGVAGELYLGGVGLGRGYWGQAGLTGASFVPNPHGESGTRLYRTGDLGRYLAAGELEFLGRVDSQVKLRGYRIELGEIDAVLGSHSAISECVTVFQDGQASDKRIVSYIVSANGYVETADLRSYLRERLPEYMVPATFIRLDRLPRTPNGKIDRRSLPAPDMTQRDTTLPYTEPRSELERRLAQIWRELLKVEKVSLHDNFFDLGGHSLLLVQMHARLREEFGLELSAIDLFKYPTIGSLAEHVQRSGTNAGDDEWLVQARARADVRRSKKDVESDIAIIGMAGRFPGATNVAEFWLNLRDGVESMREFSEDEMLAAGVSAELLRQDRYVRRGTELKGLEYFDAEFFGLTPREAEAMDPQQRMFLECAWEALEDAGYDSSSYPLPIGMFAGAATNTYMLQLISNRELFRSVGGFQTKLLNDKDFLTTRVSYKLGLKGPSLTVQTACSTSLVAVHLACQSLLNGECSMALAGGVAIVLPQRTGYLPQDGGLTSPDGHCRPFDVRAAGIVGGSGAGLVLLKRLRDALADNDSIRAVIKGSAINNDGSLKVGYTAPSIEGQAAVIAEAQAVAGVHPESISYIETHGTATTLGDPIEIAALTQAFRAQTNARQFCAIGSVKSNIGHLDTAAGVAGLIKTVLALEHGELPPSLNYEQPNPEIDFAQSPFYVNAQLREWPRREGERRAGLSSFGMGGTNAHLVLEEAPAVARTKTANDGQVILLSARSADSLGGAKQRLAIHLTDDPETELGDVAYTLQVGRRDFAHRAAVVCRSSADAAAALRSDDPRVLLQNVCEPAERPTAFLFPGIGDHYVNMAAGIYAAEETFHNEVDRCCEILKEYLGSDLRKVFFASESAMPRPASPGLDLRRMLNRDGREDGAQSKQLNETFIAQPAVFVIEYAMARLLMQWGIKPQAMMGYSIGEYVAACLAGVLSLEDALFLVARRAQLIQTLPPGALLAVPLSEDEVGEYLSEQLWVAAINGSALCVLTGSNKAVDECERKLLSKGLACRRLPTSHPFHSQLLSPIADQFTGLVSQVKLKAPKIPYISNLTGTWITATEIQDPNYWAKHMCQTVRFATGLGELWKEPRRIMLEVGPGQSLTSLALQERPQSTTAEQVALPTIRNSYEQQHSDNFFLAGTLAKLWLAGVAPDWAAVHRDKQRRRVSLPTYSFDRRYYWLPQSNGDQTKPSVHFEKKQDVESWFYLPSWKRTVPLSSLANHGRRHEKQRWLIFLDCRGLGSRIAA
ncbi:MAG TPA: amino acid adenylation domain-containing protein, partial [Pyrinomonadaceae bacterium]|nr:amino acid adenylation domain-containing protein [Pyrinomonadaceae bacterium]